MDGNRKKMEPSNNPAGGKSLAPLNQEPVLGYSLSWEPFRKTRLRFINSPPSVIFTCSRIEAEDGSPLGIELLDTATDMRVTSGPLSSLRLHITAHISKYTEENWTRQSLLAGDRSVRLKDGVGFINDIAFTSRPNCLMSNQCQIWALGNGEYAESETFQCISRENSFDRIGGHYPPDSEVWRLEGIPKNSSEALRLAEEGIHTVKDLRRCIAMNPNALRRILGRMVTNKSLDTILSHVMRYVGDEAECFTYYSQAQRAYLLFNSFYELKSLSTNGLDLLSADSLDSDLKDFVDDLKLEAYENRNSFFALDQWMFVVPPDEPLPGLQDSGFSIACSGSQNRFIDQGLGSLGYAIESFFVEFDVVFRYRRGDIGTEFITHLRAALCKTGISVNENFDKVSTPVQPVVAGPNCRVLIIFLTRSHVSSNLAYILDQRLRKNLVILPIFYGVTPYDFISESERYKRLFHFGHTEKWWEALKETTQMPSYTLADKTESELIDEIVNYVSMVLCSNVKKNMIGMDSQVKEILSLLCVESSEVRSIGLWGTVGIGKTAIAKEIFSRISAQYETCVFLKDLHEEIGLKGHDAVREIFLSKIFAVEPHVLRFSDMKTSFLRSRLQCKRLLVVLDDVHDLKDVEPFFGMLNYFGPGSRIILTSRNMRVFVLCKIDHVYEVKPLDSSNSLLLMDRGTFQNVLSPEVYRTLSLELVKFSNGNPQVLQFLRVKDWKRLSQEVQKTSPIYIPGIIERTCCGLDDNERSIFLDIACFFRRMDKDNVAMLLDGCGFSAHVGFKNLVDKSLLTISHNLVDMHNFIQATGREIVRQESEWPECCSRLWNPEDIMDLFIHNDGTSAIEGIFLDMSKLNFDANPNIFEKMCSLRLLKIYCSKEIENCGVSLPRGLEHLPSKLRLLHWEHYPLSSLPRSFDPTNLVELNLPSSSAKKLWKGKKNLEKLRKMRLSYSHQLTKIPRLSSAPNLEHIDLEGCNSLVSISQSISSLKKLVFLNLKDCSKLESIPSTVDLESLEVLNISGCSKLENFPEISPNVKELYLGGTMIQEIPSSIKNLVLLEKLDLENSRHLVNLPTSICKLKNLETLNLSGCTSLERFPNLSRRMKCLRSLDLSRTAISELPSSISSLTALEELRFVDCRNLVRLPDNAWSLRFKVEFRQIDTEKFSRLWNRFGWLKKVQAS